MSYAKPILATAIGGLSEVVTDGVNGLLVEPNNVESLAQGLHKMLNMNLETYGQNASKVAADHSWENITRSYLELFQSVLNP